MHVEFESKMAQQLQILWEDSHNLALLMSPPPESQRLFASAIHGFNICRIFHALRMNSIIHENLIKEFWLLAKTVIREAMAFTDKPTDPVSLLKEIIEGVLSEMGCEGVYPMLQKKLLIPYWRYIAHVFMLCMSGNKGIIDMLNK
ncbi:hypothetical protein R6Q59_010237 [Mikania micrantha]